MKDIDDAVYRKATCFISNVEFECGIGNFRVYSALEKIPEIRLPLRRDTKSIQYLGLYGGSY